MWKFCEAFGWFALTQRLISIISQGDFARCLQVLCWMRYGVKQTLVARHEYSTHSIKYALRFASPTTGKRRPSVPQHWYFSSIRHETLTSKFFTCFVFRSVSEPAVFVPEFSSRKRVRAINTHLQSRYSVSILYRLHRVSEQTELLQPNCVYIFCMLRKRAKHSWAICVFKTHWATFTAVLNLVGSSLRSSECFCMFAFGLRIRRLRWNYEQKPCNLAPSALFGILTDVYIHEMRWMKRKLSMAN